MGDIFDDDLGDVELDEVVLFFDNAARVGHPVVIVPCIKRSVIFNYFLIPVFILNDLSQGLYDYLLQIGGYFALVIRIL